MNWTTAILTWLIKNNLQRFKAAYNQQFDQELPIILVSGTAGKSTQTLLINQLFERSGYQVWSGTTVNRNLNALIGIGMVMLNDKDDQNIGGFWWKINLILNLFWHSYFGDWPSLKSKAVLVYELGYDHQGESSDFENVFDQVDLLIITNLTWEHTAGFENKLNTNLLEKLRKFLPKELINDFENPNLDARLLNTALEQLTFLPKAKTAITPTQIGIITNNLAVSKNSNVILEKVKASRGQNLQLVANDKLILDSQYLFPLTMAKSARILEIVASEFRIDEQFVNQTLTEFNLPAGRFGFFEGINNTKIVDSTYNSDPASLAGYLDLLIETINWQSQNLEHLNLVVAPKHTLILGEMRELGSISKVSHSQVLDQIIEIQKMYPEVVEKVILLGREWLECDSDKVQKLESKSKIIYYQKQQFKVFSKASDISETLTGETIRPHSWFWCKGSQNTIFLEIVVENLLANPEDINRLCRRGNNWDQLRSNY